MINLGEVCFCTGNVRKMTDFYRKILKIEDLNGDEKDGWDEAIVPYDLDFEISLLCKGSQNSIVYLNKNGIIPYFVIVSTQHGIISSISFDCFLARIFYHNCTFLIYHCYC